MTRPNDRPWSLEAARADQGAPPGWSPARDVAGLPLWRWSAGLVCVNL